MRHSLRAVSLWWLIVLVPILAGAAVRNKAPIARNDAATTALDTRVRIKVIANDRDRDGRIVRRTVRIVGGPRHGRARKQRNGTVIYAPNLGFSGQDTFRYRVKDNDGATSNRARVRVTVLPGARSPAADAGPDANAVTGQPVTLNGSGSSDPDGGTLAFSWRFLSIPPASARANTDIMNPTIPAPSFTPDVDGDYELELTVTDGRLSDTDGVVITAAATGHVAPNAAAGPDQHADVLTVVTLNGSASNDPDGGPDPLTFSWAFAERPSGSTATLTNATTAQPSFTLDVIGTYRVTLTVSDGNFSDQDEVVITAIAPNVPPNARAGDDFNVQLGPPAETATLDGTGSNDPDNGPNPLMFQWTFVNIPASSALDDGHISNATTATASFIPDMSGVYLLRLDVFDGEHTDFDQVMVTVQPPPPPPPTTTSSTTTTTLPTTTTTLPPTTTTTLPPTTTTSSTTTTTLPTTTTTLPPTTTTTLPPTTTTTLPPPNGAQLYASNCQSCHGLLATSTKRNCTAAEIDAAIANVPQMQSIQLSAAQIAAIATALDIGTVDGCP